MENHLESSLYPNFTTYPEHRTLPPDIFRFDLKGHKPRYPAERGVRGEVTFDIEVPRRNMGELANYTNLSVRELFVSSPVIEADKEAFGLADEYVNHIEEHLLEVGINPSLY